MRTPKEHVLFDMLEQLKKYCETDSVSMPEWISYDGNYLGEGKYEFFPETAETKKLGEHWFARYDCARIFKTQCTLPESFKGKKIYLNLDFGGEIMVKIDGKIANSVSSRENSGWVARETVVMNDKFLKFGEPMDIELEAVVDSASFCNDAMAGKKEMEYKLKFANFACIDEICEKFYLNCVMAWDALKYIKDAYIREAVYKVLDDSLHLVDFNFDDSDTRKSIAEACEYFDTELAKIKHTPQFEVIMDGHSHLDIAWLWRVQETERKTSRTFANNLALMDHYPEFTFTQSQAIVYHWIKNNNPELYERIKEKVKNVQWNIVGNTWVECDTNVASGESMIRQLLYGREFFLKEFGVSSDTYWLPDCFGFSHALPQIIKKSGMKYFITSKLRNQDTNRFPHTLFKWKGADGSEILAFNQRTHYQGDYDPAYLVESADECDLKGSMKTAFGMFGYGDGGGGSTYRMLENAKRLKNFPGLPSARMGHPQEFFAEAEKIRDELPVYNDELYYENHRGTYTSQGFIKKRNRKNEFLLSRIEMAGVFGKGYDKERMQNLWLLLLKNQFHDILPGTSIHEAMEDCRPDFKKLENEGNEMFNSALDAIIPDINVTETGIIVWNFLSHTVTAPVTVKGNKSFDSLCRSFTKNGEEYTEFIAENVPAMGYKFFPYATAKDAENVHIGDGVIENKLLRVEYDENGILTSIFDKENNRETLDGEGNLISVFIDKCVHETAWNLEQNYEKKKWELRKAESIEITERSPLRAVLKVTRKFNKSTITQNIILYADSRKVLFETEIDWQERDKVMKAAFDVNILNNEATFEAAHGAIKRPTHRNSPFDAARYEQCAHKWADLSEGDYGVSILNDCKYGYDILDSRMRITLLRAPTCPDRKGDLGMHTFTYAYYPHAGTWQTGGTVKEAFELNLPLKATLTNAHEGKLPDCYSFINCDNDDIIIDAVKQAQDGNGIILRVYESRRVRGDRTLTVNLPFSKVYECNLMEENEGEFACSDNKLIFNIKPFEVKTFRLVK
ncbi:MAG: alpha-mannosidase [Clostridia bacterium]|nr:alpha-mannosidase [Clostridia bacterium]